jgi:hypothetical protein
VRKYNGSFGSFGSFFGGLVRFLIAEENGCGRMELVGVLVGTINVRTESVPKNPHSCTPV